MYWYFAAERQEIFFKKFHGEAAPFTKDPILQTYKFCNTYRASDRVSQCLIKDVIYANQTPPEDTLFRIIFFRLLNKDTTWKKLEEKLGAPVSLENFNTKRYATLLEEIKNEEGVIYGNAFILASTHIYGLSKKYENHLQMLHELFVSGKKKHALLNAKTLEELYIILHTLPMIGDFMAYQIAIDLHYSTVFNFDENDFTVAGPGAQRGITKCFEDTDNKPLSYIIQYMVENQDEEFKRLGIQFKNLWGRKLHAIDCQGLFCETDKYCRVRYPNLASNRIR